MPEIATDSWERLRKFWHLRLRWWVVSFQLPASREIGWSEWKSQSHTKHLGTLFSLFRAFFGPTSECIFHTWRAFSTLRVSELLRKRGKGPKRARNKTKPVPVKNEFTRHKRKSGLRTKSKLKNDKNVNNVHCRHDWIEAQKRRNLI